MEMRRRNLVLPGMISNDSDGRITGGMSSRPPLAERMSGTAASPLIFLTHGERQKQMKPF